MTKIRKPNGVKLTGIILLVYVFVSQVSPREGQEQSLVQGLSEKQQKAVEALVLYPEKVRNAVLEASLYPEILVKISNIQERSREKFKEILSPYNRKIQETIWDLVRFPEILSILTENISLTILLGDMYKNNPQQIKKQLEELQVEGARQQSQAVNSWRKSLEDDPEAMEEFQQAAEEYAREQGYDDEKMKISETEKVADTRTRVEVYYVNPYPYWFGYPYWYSYPRWYRYPYWYDWGFYYGPGGTVIIVDLPSYYYVDWHFRRYHYVRQYPRISNRFIIYSQRHRNLNTDIKRAVEHRIRKYPQESPQFKIRKESLGKPTQPPPPANDLKERKYQLKQESPNKHKQLQKAREYHKRTWKVQPVEPSQKPQTPAPQKSEQKKQEKKKDNKE
ncbi:MAG: DUF3300 domain-containing protein [Candidatus Aminicenantes bacterium]|nr:MAG: DUF3300 domain-containing protein [Candidatus Aminicenantes bacterium]